MPSSCHNEWFDANHKLRILTRPMAEAVYSAMCALNNVGAKLKVSIGNVAIDGVRVFEDTEGNVIVIRVSAHDVLAHEDYADQSSFAAAYGLS